MKTKLGVGIAGRFRGAPMTCTVTAQDLQEAWLRPAHSGVAALMAVVLLSSNIAPATLKFDSGGNLPDFFEPTIPEKRPPGWWTKHTGH